MINNNIRSSKEMSKIKLNNARKKKPINYESNSESDIDHDYDLDNIDMNNGQHHTTDLLKILDKKYVNVKQLNKSENANSKPSSLFKDDNSNEEKIEIIDKILKMFPEMKNQRNIILSEILLPKQPIDDRYILEKIIINNKTYYKDKYRNIIDTNINLVGMWELETGDFRYHLFEDEVGKVINYKEVEEVLGMTCV